MEMELAGNSALIVISEKICGMDCDMDMAGNSALLM